VRFPLLDLADGVILIIFKISCSYQRASVENLGDPLLKFVFVLLSPFLFCFNLLLVFMDGVAFNLLLVLTMRYLTSDLNVVLKSDLSLFVSFHIVSYLLTLLFLISFSPHPLDDQHVVLVFFL